MHPSFESVTQLHMYVMYVYNIYIYTHTIYNIDMEASYHFSVTFCSLRSSIMAIETVSDVSVMYLQISGLWDSPFSPGPASISCTDMQLS